MLALLFFRMSDSSFAGFFGCGGANRGAGPDAASSMEKQSEKINCEAANAAKRDCGSGRDNSGAGIPSSGTDAVREATVGEVGTEEPDGSIHVYHHVYHATLNLGQRPRSPHATSRARKAA